MTVEFFFAPGSRYSYLAASQMPRLAADTGAAVVWRPVSGADVRALRGRDPFAGEPVSGQYDWAYRRADAEAWADYYGIPFREPPSHDAADFRLVTRAAAAAAHLGAAERYGWLACRAVYDSDAWPLDEALCMRLAADAGLAADAFTTALHDPATDRALAETAADAHARGVFGVPTCLAGGRLFWGNDRLVLLRHFLERAA